MSAFGKVYLVGAGPGDPELLTIKAAGLLASADVILHDDLVPQAVLVLANTRACILNVGKRCGRKSITQAGIHQLMIDCARRSLSVVRLKSGDPLVFGRAAEEMDALRAAGLAFEVVPGITAAFAAAASIECSLTDRRSASSILLTSGHHATGPTTEPKAEQNSPTRVVYMPGRDLTYLAAQWSDDGLGPTYPCAVISRAAQPDQLVTRATLATLAATQPGPAPVLVIGGWVLDTPATNQEAARQANLLEPNLQRAEPSQPRAE
jgi:uroporphyrin-III C-methyltransferase